MTSAVIDDYEEPEKKQGFFSRLFNKIADTIEFVRADIAQDADFQSRWNETRRVQNINDVASYILTMPECDGSQESIKEIAEYHINANKEVKASGLFHFGDITAQDIIDRVENLIDGVEEKRGQESPAHDITL